MICLIMGKHNNPFVSQWKIKTKHWNNIDTTIPLSLCFVNSILICQKVSILFPTRNAKNILVNVCALKKWKLYEILKSRKKLKKITSLIKYIQEMKILWNFDIKKFFGKICIFDQMLWGNFTNKCTHKNAQVNFAWSPLS